MDRGRAKFLRLTAMGGVMFLCVKAFEWTHEIREGFVLSSGGFWSFYYTVAGLHALHVLAGLIIMLVFAVDAAKNGNCSAWNASACTGILWTLSGFSCFRCSTSLDEAT